VIIDGRIFDICNSGVIEGALIIPEFVLDELRHIADSSDDLKRNRGRRGLDVLGRIQNELKLPVKVVHAETDSNADVDAKLLTLAKDMDGVVVTNDYNLNKVAAVKNVRVININELANAVKPVVLPGEEMRVTVVKEGKETGQGIAYLDDGTMIVVEDGQKETGRPVAVIVTSVLQTSAGRMIFARVKQA
jgi:Integral membrane protein (PIN domain superfamily)